jgi:hypothetical protein
MSQKLSFDCSIPQEILAKADKCNKEFECLKQGPKCRVGAIINQNILVVDCLDADSECAFFVALSSQSRNRGQCTCPVRHAFHKNCQL